MKHYCKGQRTAQPCGVSIYIIRVLVIQCMDKLILWGGSGDPILMLLSILALVSSQISLYGLIGYEIDRLSLI